MVQGNNILPNEVLNAIRGVGSNPGDFSLAAHWIHLDGTMFTPAPLVWIGGVYVEDGDEHEIDPKDKHKIYADYTLNNANPTILYPFWTGCITLFNVTDSKAVVEGFKSAEGHEGQGGPEVREVINLPAITKPTTFRLNIMGNQKKGASSPPGSLWRERVG